MVDHYWRKIESVKNDVENSLQMAGILLKLKEYDEKINTMDNNSKIDDNKINISSNLEKIDDNKNNIATNSGTINTNTNDIATNFKKIGTNTNDIATNSGKIIANEGAISINLGKIDNNLSNIASNLEKIDVNKEDILSLKNSNVKPFHNLDKIFIYDIPKGNQTVSKNNYYHIFEKEIIYDFVKESYLEIISEVLTEISNYVLIGFFKILFNFHDENDDLFYTISLSTAMGSINKLSTIKSVFIVPINKHMKKIKIDFFITPKENQENRTAQFIIHEMNSNKIYIKYYQETNEMSIKNIEDSLNTVNNISSNLEQIDHKINEASNSIKLKNIFNILFYNK